MLEAMLAPYFAKATHRGQTAQEQVGMHAHLPDGVRQLAGPAHFSPALVRQPGRAGVGGRQVPHSHPACQQEAQVCRVHLATVHLQPCCHPKRKQQLVLLKQRPAQSKSIQWKPKKRSAGTLAKSLRQAQASCHDWSFHHDFDAL